jgi:hypothetical protein
MSSFTLKIRLDKESLRTLQGAGYNLCLVKPLDSARSNVVFASFKAADLSPEMTFKLSDSYSVSISQYLDGVSTSYSNATSN